MRTALTCISFMAAVVGGCGSERGPDVDSGPGLAVEVAPLALPGIVDATYQLTVKNAVGETVWTRGPLSSVQYGDGQGALSYVGPCDASGGLHTIELVLLSLTDTTGPLDSPEDYVNPTQRSDGSVVPVVVRGVECQANADTLVPISLTIMRSARQGFFDFAVEFDDIFCSAKLDCNPRLLHDGDERSATAILAFACASGTGEPTNLYLSDLTLTCTDGATTTTTVLDVTPQATGQQGTQSADVFQWAVYQGREFLDAAGESDIEKCFWNHAVGLDLGALEGKSCTLSATGTASESPLATGPNGYTLPRTGSYPYIEWSAQVLSAGGALCDNYALNASGQAVVTRYALNDTPVDDLPRLTARMQCGAPAELACATGAGALSVAPTTDGLTLSSVDGSIPARTFQLPAGYSVGDACCTPGCCQ